MPPRSRTHVKTTFAAIFELAEKDYIDGVVD